MDETELEEGEACFDDNDESIDPDTTFFYIDKRLQDMLGHFQKDFEGDISIELLDAFAYSKLGSDAMGNQSWLSHLAVVGLLYKLYSGGREWKR
ncbi:hypothetical protein L6452_32331 [Arctium lappa]|uniref:Uncharacterized protein n=1 Tax=Arctium lappa TaxID=4217 RepID=A0ACB8Z5J5_ARCLA|nr:hypothetical protein L6452_32331 [Arctium lappa]